MGLHALLQGSNFPYTMGIKLRGPQSKSGRCWAQKILLPLPGTSTPLISTQTSSVLSGTADTTDVLLSTCLKNMYIYLFIYLCSLAAKGSMGRGMHWDSPEILHWPRIALPFHYEITEPWDTATTPRTYAPGVLDSNLCPGFSLSWGFFVVLLQTIVGITHQLL
jgi:hypothetical protein